MKILSWNIWVDSNLAQVKEFLKIANADIIGLQEVQTDKPNRDIVTYLKKLGYQHIFAQTKQIWDGNVFCHGPAIFSRLPVIHSQAYMLNKEDEHAAAYAEIKSKNNTLHIFSTHLVHTHQKPSLQQETEMLQLIQKLPENNVVVMGDFNATPDSTSIQKISSILSDTDPESLATWSTHPKGCEICNPQKINMRLDYIFVSKDIKTHSFEVGESLASDHLPILVDIEI